MPSTLTLELPDDLAEALRRAAGRSGQTVEEWAALRLRLAATPTDEERRAGLERLLRHTVSLGGPLGCDNEGIDADLAREYGDTHDPDGTP